MLTCIACSKQLGGSLQHEPDDDDVAGTPSTRQAIKALTAQIKEMALKASGAYRHCKPCSGSAGQHHQHHRYSEPDTASGSERFHYSYRRAAACSGLGSSASTPRAGALGKETESRLRAGALSSGDLTPSSVSGRTEGGGVVLPEEEEQQLQKEWVAQVEPGVLITFVSIAQGGNDLKRIRFSREMFNKWQAQRWWAENCEKVMELYNVQRFNRQAVPLPTPPRSEDEISKMESAEDSPVTPPLSKERLPRNFHRPVPNVAGGVAASSSDSLDRRPLHHARHYCCDSGGLASTPKLSSISGAKTETSSMDASGRTSSSREGEEEEEDEDRSASVSNASDQEREWVEQDEPGVYITIRSLPGGVRELRRVRFSRERFSEMHARLWWEENRARIHEQYL